MLRREGDDKVELLRNVPLFSACSKKELRRIAALADELEFREGKILTRQGGPGREMFILLDGTVKVERNGVQVNALGPGDFLGEELSCWGSRATPPSPRPRPCARSSSRT